MPLGAKLQDREHCWIGRQASGARIGNVRSTGKAGQAGRQADRQSSFSVASNRLVEGTEPLPLGWLLVRAWANQANL